MEEATVTATFGPAASDRATLSKASRTTMEALYRHPLAHNLQWSDVVALFEKLGMVDHASSNEIGFGIGGEHHRLPKPHAKDLTTADVLTFRHMLTRAGWAPRASPEPPPSADDAGGDAAAIPVPAGLLVVVDHHEARLFHLDIRFVDLADHAIGPHHVSHLLSRKDQSHGRNQGTPDDREFQERIAQAVALGGRIVLIGHGKGHGNAAHQLNEYLRLHHPETFRKVACELVADLSSLTEPQLLDLGRRALTAGTPSIAH